MIKDNIEISIIVPAFNESKNLPLLYQEINRILKSDDLEWELIIIDDHSSDETFDVIQSLSDNDTHVRGYRLSRNFGSHKAILCGLEKAKGSCAVILAADMQDPPHVIPNLLDQWRNGNQVVWAVRASRGGERKSTIGFSQLYYLIMRRVIGIKEIPSSGADFFLLDRRVINTITNFNEANVSILALISWIGFRQSFIYYDKQARIHGRSGWNLEKKFKLAIDSLTSFSYMPIRFMSLVGFIVSLLGFLYAGVVIFNALFGPPPQGWSSLMVVILVVGGIQMMMMGVLGEYMWRSLDESRNRPLYIIEKETDGNEREKQDTVY